MIVDSGASIPRAIADDQFLEHFHDDTTTANLKCDEILDHIGPSSAPDPTTLKRPHLQQRVLPSKEQRVLDLSVQQTQPIKYRRTSGLNTTTPEANMRVHTHDINNHSHLPTARRLTWEDERVPGPGLNLKINGNQSFQTNAEIWAQSEATEINSLIQSCVISPIYDEPVRTNAMKAPAISTYVSMRFATKPISSQSNFRRHYTNKLVATWMQMRAIATKARMESKQPRDLSGSRSNIFGQKYPISSKSGTISAEKRETKPMSNTL